MYPRLPNVGKKAPSSARGFTLIELIITVAIIGILAMIAVPSFNEAMLSNKLNALSNHFVASAHLARSEAIKRNGPVTLCASSDGTSCSGSWQDGWVVLGGSTVLHKQSAFPSGFMLSGAVNSIAFQPSGTGATQAILTLCRATPTVGTRQREISISATGRPGVKTTTSATCS